MKLHSIWTLSWTLSLSLVTPALATPPVEVNEDEEPIFEGQGVQGVKGQSEKLFEALQREERARIKRRKRAAQNENINTQTNQQTVNVYIDSQSGAVETEVIDPRQRPEAQAPGMATPKSQRRSLHTEAQRPVGKQTKRRRKANRRRRGVTTRMKKRKSWWRGPAHVRRGDFMMQMQGGLHDGGGFFGLGVEGMVSNVVGVRFGGYYSAFDRDDLIGGGANWDFIDSNRWGTGGVQRATFNQGSAHLLDLGLAFHVLKGSSFDLYPSIGVSHFGYSLDHYGQANDRKGGSGFLRLGGGFNYHIRRIYLGLDFGWYVFEMFRYQVVQEGRRGSRAEGQAIDGRWNAGRFTASAQIGVRF